MTDAAVLYHHVTLVILKLNTASEALGICHDSHGHHGTFGWLEAPTFPLVKNAENIEIYISS